MNANSTPRVSKNSAFSALGLPRTIEALSHHVPFYLSCEFRKFGKTRRDVINHHVNALVDEMVYNPGKEEPVELEPFTTTFTKILILKAFILIDQEPPNYGKQ